MVVAKVLAGGVTVATAAAYGKAVYAQSQLPKNKLTPWSNETKKKVVVVGAGCLGVSTAYRLATKGYSVTVLDSKPAAAMDCSAAPAGGMQRSSYVVDRSKWVAVAKCVFPRLSSLVLGGEPEKFNFFQINIWKTFTDPHFIRWALAFSYNSLFPSPEFHKRQDEMLKFTDYAVKEMQSVMEANRGLLGKKAGYNKLGAMQMLFGDPDSILADPDKLKNKYSLEPFKILTGADIIKEEPSIQYMETQPTAVKYEYDALAADSERFTKAMAEKCVTEPGLDVTFLYDTRVQGVDVVKDDTRRQSIAALRTNQGVIEVDSDTQVVVAAGTFTPLLLSFCGLYCPVYGLKGYCIPFTAPKSKASKQLPGRIISDASVFTSRLGDQIRVTSIGEFSGWSTKPDPVVDQRFRQAAVERMPQLKEEIESHPTRCGLRPYVCDGIVLLGRVDALSNLLVNCGPGSNGWKICEGAGEVIARLVANENVDSLGFEAKSLAPTGRVVSAPIFSKICQARWQIDT